MEKNTIVRGHAAKLLRENELLKLRLAVEQEARSDLEDAVVELAELQANQEDALVELAGLMEE